MAGSAQTPEVRQIDVATRDRVLRVVLDAGAVVAGVCGVDVLTEARGVISRRRSVGLHDGMAFTYRNPQRSTDPLRAFPSARSAVVVAFPYDTARSGEPGRLSGEVARYASGDTYGELRNVLLNGADELRASGHRAVVLADDNALVDRSMAARAGLGWLGKNTNLLVPGAGSWVVLGSILTDAPLPSGATAQAGSDPTIERGCGSCTRCLTACPTGALIAPGVMDNSRCLSWLLQRTGDFPRQYRVALGRRIYGCDDCQEVCPPSMGVSRGSTAPGDWADLEDLLTSSDSSLLDRFGAWYIPRRDPRYLRRNALVVLGNVAALRALFAGCASDVGATDEPAVTALVLLRRYLGDEDPLLVAHASWAARRAGVEWILHEDPWQTHPEVLAEMARPHPRSTELLVGGRLPRDNGSDGST